MEHSFAKNIVGIIALRRLMYFLHLKKLFNDI